MSELTDLEFRIIDELYFVTSFNDLLDLMNEDQSKLPDGLKGLLEKELITQLVFDENLKDYRRLDTPDLEALERSCFVASKQGLLIHNSRS